MTRTKAFRPTLMILEDRWLPAVGIYPDPFRNTLQASYAAQAKLATNPVVFLGDSITYNWGTATRPSYGSSTFGADFSTIGAANFGIGGDHAQNVLWRIEAGDLAGKPKLAVVMIGINDLAAGSTPIQTAEGIAAIVQAIRAESPTTKVLLLGVLPTEYSPLSAKVQQLDSILADQAPQPGVTYLDAGTSFLGPDGNALPNLMTDVLHPNALGYQVLEAEIGGTVHKLLDRANAVESTTPVTTPKPAPIENASTATSTNLPSPVDEIFDIPPDFAPGGPSAVQTTLTIPLDGTQARHRNFATELITVPAG